MGHISINEILRLIEKHQKSDDTDTSAFWALDKLKEEIKTMETVKHNTKSLQECKDEVAREWGHANWRTYLNFNSANPSPAAVDRLAILYASSLTQQVEELTEQNKNLRTALDALDKVRVSKSNEIEELKKENASLNLELEMKRIERIWDEQKEIEFVKLREAALNSPSKQGE